jgi:putative Holliday junction resolvase
MALTDFKDFPKQGRLLGIDWGSKRTGLAISDESREFVFARNHEPGGANQADRIAGIIREEKIAGAVVGLPLRSDGSDSDTTRKVREFAASLSLAAAIPVAFMEENLTSVEAGQIADGKKQKANLDSISAAIILENAIAMIKRQGQ